MFIRVAGRNIPLTDFTAIATLRMLLEEVHIEEFTSLWRGLTEAQRDWYIQTSTGTALRRRIADFGFVPPGAQPAYGQVWVTLSEAGSVSKDTVVRTDPADGSAPQRYTVDSNPDNSTDGSWPTDSNNMALVHVIANAAGAAGNVGPGQIVATDSAIEFVVTDGISNPAAMVNGRDAPSDTELRELFRGYLFSLTRGTRPALLSALSTFVGPQRQRVHSAALEEWGGQTLLDAADVPVALKVYVDEGYGSGSPGDALAGDTFIGKLQTFVDGDPQSDASGWRAAGIPTAVVAARAVAIAVNVNVDIDRAFSPSAVLTAVNDAVLRFFTQLSVSGIGMNGEQVGQVSLPRLVNAVDDLPGVLRSTWIAPRTDLAVPTGYKAVAFTAGVTITGQVV
jgi:hypothetical protein